MKKLIAVSIAAAFFNVHSGGALGGNGALAFVSIAPLSPDARHATTRLHAASPSKSGDDDEEEWRAFRARLVRDGLPSLDDGVVSAATESSDDGEGGAQQNQENARGHRRRDEHHYAHVTTPLVEVGSVLVSVPTTDLCQAIEQQYWHRAVVLITHVSDNPVSGDAFDGEVPDDQLAHGDRRGRWSYRGLMLNRCTDLADAVVASCANDEEDGSCVEYVRRGGDLMGLDSSAGTEFACLGYNVSDVDFTRLVGDLAYMRLDDVQRKRTAPAHSGAMKDDDDDHVLAFAGFCSWRPGQLEREMGDERDEWMVLSVDGRTVWNELRLQSKRVRDATRSHGDDPRTRGKLVLESGTEMWRSLLGMIDVSEARATRRLPPGQLRFYDGMLEVWAEENLSMCRKSGDGGGVDSLGNGPDRRNLGDSAALIGPGTLLRAASPPTNDMLLYDAEFVRSTILVLEDTADGTMGIMLNHPMMAAVECVEGEEPIVLRYGGPADVQSWRDGSFREGEGGDEVDCDDNENYEGFLEYENGEGSFEDLAFDGDFGDEDDEDSLFIWIHRNAALGSRQVGGGKRLGASNNLWLIKEDDGLKHIQAGSLQLDDVMIFSGVCIWEKSTDGQCGGGVREQVDSLRSLEVVRAWNHDRSEDGDDEAIDDVWDVLRRQRILSKETLESNMHASVDAWGISSYSGQSKDFSGRRSQLADAALKAWIGVNLLQDPLGTVVEVRRDESRQETSGNT